MQGKINVTSSPAITAEQQARIDLLIRSLTGEFGETNRIVGDEFLTHAATAVAKNRDYGSSVFQDVLTDDGKTIPAEDAIQVRIQDKKNRLKQLLSSDEPALVAESVFDTYRDWSVYVALLGMLRTKKTNGLGAALAPSQKEPLAQEEKAAPAVCPGCEQSDFHASWCDHNGCVTCPKS